MALQPLVPFHIGVDMYFRINGPIERAACNDGRRIRAEACFFPHLGPKFLLLPPTVLLLFLLGGWPTLRGKASFAPFHNTRSFAMV